MGGEILSCVTKTSWQPITWEKLDGLVRNTRDHKYVKYTQLVLGHHER